MFCFLLAGQAEPRPNLDYGRPFIILTLLSWHERNKINIHFYGNEEPNTITSNSSTLTLY